MSSNLQHHGVKGMKWGVRRYQNKDGSLKPAGKKRVSHRKIRKTEKEIYKEEVEKVKSDITKQINKDLSDAVKTNNTTKLAELNTKEYDVDYVANYKTSKKLVEKYGQERIDQFYKSKERRKIAMDVAYVLMGGRV